MKKFNSQEEIIEYFTSQDYLLSPTNIATLEYIGGGIEDNNTWPIWLDRVGPDSSERYMFYRVYTVDDLRALKAVLAEV